MVINEVNKEDIKLDIYNPKNKLNPKFFKEDGMLKSEVRMALLDITDDFIKTLKVNWVKPKHIYIIGSVVNFNWNRSSDIDINIMYDFKKVYKKEDFVEDYFYSKRNDWNKKHEHIRVKGYPVEFTIVDINKQGEASGVYDLEKNKWVKEPKDMNDSALNKPYIKRYCAKKMTKIDEICGKIDKETDRKKIETLANKLAAIEEEIIDVRKAGLKTKEKEMSTGNIIAKVIKHAGYIEKIRSYVAKAYDKQVSVAESKKVICISEDQAREIEKRVGNNILYVAVVLDEESKHRLMEAVKKHLVEDQVPNWNDFKIICHHHTIAFKNNLTDDLVEWANEHNGDEFEMTTNALGVSDKALAVEVETDLPCANKVKHITVMTNPETNGKPVDSNYITDWTPFEKIPLKGRLEIFYR